MLQSLKISNIALIQELTINFKNNLNILTGETGSGKSIIIDSLNFLLGARADKTLIRTGESDARVVGVFILEKTGEFVESFFAKLNIEPDSTIIISRQMNINGKSITQVNGEFVTASMIKELTPYLIDIHGQNEHQFLLSSKNQLTIIDDYFYKMIDNIKQDYLLTFNEIKQVNAGILSFGGSKEDRLRQIDLLEYEINEITSAKLDEKEEEELFVTLKRLQNAEKIANNLTTATYNLENLGASGIVGALSLAINSLDAVASYDDSIAKLSDRLHSAKLELEDATFELNDLASSLEFDQNEFDRVDERLDEIKRLKRKYGSTIEEVLNYLQKATIKLDNLMSSAEELEKLNKQKQNLLKELLLKATKLSNARKQGAKELTQAILAELVDLGMPNAKLEIEFNDLATLEDIESVSTSNGVDQVEFMFSANLGEPVKLLTKIISGGEMSRFMLAIKTIIAKTDNIPTMVFDEIDTGISGKMAQAVSKKLAIISKTHQVLVVSHLPQIAAMADNHYYIEKKVESGKTLTKVMLVEGNLLIEEIARMLSGVKLTDASISNAAQLKDECNKYKLSL
ncbi:MAG: DNA repair protein RecN [Clostridia bacterium]|nr:DNA repair protein RecN [Clostridia bacterium]